MGTDAKFYVLPNDTPVVGLGAKNAFQLLSKQEREYAHYLSKASFEGGLAVLLQVSPEAPLIHVLLRRLFEASAPDDFKPVALEKGGLTEDEYQEWACLKALLVYTAGFISNSGNYKGFGDTKFVPGLPCDKLEATLKASTAWNKEMEELWGRVKGPMYSLDQRVRNLGFGVPETGGQSATTTYLSANCSKKDTELVDRFMAAEGLEAWNTRLFKTIDENGKANFEIRLASVDQSVLRPPKEFEEALIEVTSGDYSPLLERVVNHLESAKACALNAEESKMLGKYMEHFLSGDLNAHKDGSRAWIRDKGPIVESYIGFIENYRDPAGTRSEFEGFVAAVDKATSAKFEKLVSEAEELLKRLPWGKDYEKDSFLKPDFTSLDVIAFSGSGVPAGINIPNYDEIRQNEGFKNVSLGNVIGATPKIKVNFISDEDDALYKEYHAKSFEVQVGLHELLGHGSGKLFIRKKNGEFNFDKASVKDLVTGGEITSWYEEGETWGSKFGQLASAYEECRAEAVGYVLCCEPDILSIFGVEGEEAEKVKYVNWLLEIRAGLAAVEFYSPEKKAWGQAHCHARYVLTQVVLEAGEGFVTIEETVGEDGAPDLKFRLDRTKIDSVGKPATQQFLKKLQAYKSSGDAAGGKALFDHYGIPTEQALRWREICIARRKPRRIIVQPNTRLCPEEGALLQEYPETFSGVVDGWLARVPADTDADLLALAAKDAKHFL